MSITIISRFVGTTFDSEYFFSTSHSQPNLSTGFVPITYNGNWTKEQVKKFNDQHGIEIPNPDPNYQA